MAFLVVGQFRIQEGEVAGLFQVGRDSQDEPQMIVAIVVGTVLGFVGVTDCRFHCHRIELVHPRTISSLHLQQLGQQSFGFGGYISYDAHYVLSAVPHPQTACAKPHLVE